MALWREGTTGPLSDEAVDMMDNARALPTSVGGKDRRL
jgi:hypothetical protein